MSYLAIISANTLHSIVYGLCLGALAGWMFFRTLLANVDLFVKKNHWLLPLALQVLRLMFIGTVLYLCARSGFSLVAMLAGLLFTRSVMLCKVATK